MLILSYNVQNVIAYLNCPASALAKQVTNQELYRLSRLRGVGDVAQLVLQSVSTVAQPCSRSLRAIPTIFAR
jgi:hypothetical protein